jgi:hypothetical protein
MINTADQGPPKWAECVLECLLPQRDRETVVGDLREEYAESVLPSRGMLRADLWYLRHLPGFVWRCIAEETTPAKTLFCTSLFMLLCNGWLITMELLLQHPGYRLRIALELCSVAICIAAIFVRVLHAGIPLERSLWPAALVLIGVGGASFFRNVQAVHFEGFIALVSIAFALQGTLMLLSLGRQNRVVSTEGFDDTGD